MDFLFFQRIYVCMNICLYVGPKRNEMACGCNSLWPLVVVVESLWLQ